MKRFSQKEKDDFVQGYLQSGISCTEYCKGNGLHPNSTPNPYIEVRTKGTRIQIPASIGNEQIAFLFSLMGLAHGS